MCKPICTPVLVVGRGTGHCWTFSLGIMAFERLRQTMIIGMDLFLFDIPSQKCCCEHGLIVLLPQRTESQ